VKRGPGFAVFYRWRLHPGAEASFIDAWSRVSERLRAERGSLGSRLHRGPDGLWYSYAQWPSAEARELAFASAPVDAAASAQMREAIAESLPELVLESVSDFMVLPPGDLR
jgi:heme-degrading monooxygenase HmoA